MPIHAQTDLTEEEMKRIQLVIKDFLVQSNHRELFETRIQKLIFYSEVYCVFHYDRRLTHAEYRPYMYGAFSPDVRIAIESLEGVKRRKTVIHGERTTGYSIKNHTGSVNDDVREIIERVCDHVKNESTENLAQFSKDSWLFENTEYDHPMNFSELNKALNAHNEIKKELGKQLPSRIDEVVPEENLVSLTR